MTKEPIEKNDLYHLSAIVADALKDYGAIRYLDSDEVPYVLLVVDETELNAGGPTTDRLVRLSLDFVKIEVVE